MFPERRQAGQRNYYPPAAGHAADRELCMRLDPNRGLWEKTHNDRAEQAKGRQNSATRDKQADKARDDGKCRDTVVSVNADSTELPKYARADTNREASQPRRSAPLAHAQPVCVHAETQTELWPVRSLGEH